jgi:hypothetical protein
MARSRVATPAAVTPRGGRISTARRGLQPTCTAPSGRSSTGSAGSSAYSDGVGCAILALCHGKRLERLSYPQRRSRRAFLVPIGRPLG